MQERHTFVVTAQGRYRRQRADPSRRRRRLSPLALSVPHKPQLLIQDRAQVNKSTQLHPKHDPNFSTAFSQLLSPKSPTNHLATLSLKKHFQNTHLSLDRQSIDHTLTQNERQMQKSTILNANTHNNFRVITLPRMNFKPAPEEVQSPQTRASVMLAMERDYRKRLICDRINYLCKQGAVQKPG